MRLGFASLVATLAVVGLAPCVFAQPVPQNTVLRTEYGQPDLQGVWAIEFLTPLERPNGVDDLIVTREQAEAVSAAIRKAIPAVHDPDLDIQDVQQLAIVRGQYRTSVIVEPTDGRMPFTQTGADLSARVRNRNSSKFDNPEERPSMERCLEGFISAPIRSGALLLPFRIVQTSDAVVIAAEDVAGLRIIHLSGASLPEMIRSIEGYSSGHWEGDTLVVLTTHLRADDPGRFGAGRPLVLTPKTRVTERFTRVSEAELLYQFTVEDADLYTRPWTGEFSMRRYDGPVYEYACHEGNEYSMTDVLRVGRVADSVVEKANR